MSRVSEAVRTGGMRRLGQKTQIFTRRRYYKVLSLLEKVRAEIEPLDAPADTVAGCMYRTRVRVTNRSRVTWNESGKQEPHYAIAAFIHHEDGFQVDGPHTILPCDFAPGQSHEIDVVLEVPRKPGQCRIKFDVVRENCFWLQELGYPCVEIPLQVLPHSHALLKNRIPALDVTLDITNKCPLKCIQCRKTYFETFDEQQDMDFEMFGKIAAEVFPFSRAVSLSSAGEPLMTRNFLEAIAVTRRYGVPEISFISSGMHLDHGRAEKIIDLGVTRIEFSLDGASAAVYNKIRIGSNYDKVIHNISYLNDLKVKKRSRTPLLRFNFVLMKSNIHELPDFIDLAARLGVEEVQTQHMVIFVDQVRDEALVFHKQESNHYIQKAIQRAQYHGIRFYHPPLFQLEETVPDSGAQIVDGKIWKEENSFDYERKTHPILKDGMQLCTDPWRKLFIDWQGQVFPCCVWKEAPLGDLRRSSFEDIWHSERYQQLRNGLTGGTLGKSCAECSVITGGDINRERSYFF